MINTWWSTKYGGVEVKSSRYRVCTKRCRQGVYTPKVNGIELKVIDVTYVETEEDEMRFCPLTGTKESFTSS